LDGPKVLRSCAEKKASEGIADFSIEKHKSRKEKTTERNWHRQIKSQNKM
jgi:hypothetical protein